MYVWVVDLYRFSFCMPFVLNPSRFAESSFLPFYAVNVGGGYMCDHDRVGLQLPEKMKEMEKRKEEKKITARREIRLVS